MGKKANSTVRRLLVISYHFPPDGAIGGQRWAGLSKYLARLGWEVHVLTASAPGQEPSTPSVHRHVRRRRRTLDDFYKARVGRWRNPPQTDQQTFQGNSRPRLSPRLSRPLAAMRRTFGSAMFLPDHGRGWIGRAAAAARGLLREQDFDIVITSGPPHSSHFAGLLATRGSAARFWVDMRDPWSITHGMHLPPDGLIRAERFFLRQLEKLVFRHAAKVIVNTREFASGLKDTHPEVDVSFFPNGVDLEEMPARDASTVEHGSIAHVGTLYANRSLSSVFAGMSAVLRDRAEATPLRLDVAGPMDPSHRERMQAEITAAGVTSLVNIHGVLPRKEALDLLSRSHLALVLAQGQPMCVPAKLYESVGLGIPTLVIAEETSAAACEARRIGAMTLDESDVEGVRALLGDMLACRIPTMITPRVPVSYEELAIHMDRLLRDTVERRPDATKAREPFTSTISSERRTAALEGSGRDQA